MSGKRSTLSPRPFPGQGKGAALEDISPVAPWEVAQPGQPVKGAKHRRIAAAMPLTGSPSYAMGGAATGDKSGRASVDGTGKTGGNFWSRCSEAVQKHRSDFSGSGVLRKVDSPLSLFTFVKERYPPQIPIYQPHSITHSVHFPACVSQRRCGRSRVIARQSALLHTAANSQVGLLF